MPVPAEIITQAIEQAPYNMGLTGAAWLASEGNVPVTFDDGGVILFDYEGETTYQGHFLLQSHGRKAVDQVKQAFAQMFNQHGAHLLFGLIPDERRDVKLVARWAGARSVGKRVTPYGPCEMFVLSNLMFFRKVN